MLSWTQLISSWLGKEVLMHWEVLQYSNSARDFTLATEVGKASGQLQRLLGLPTRHL